MSAKDIFHEIVKLALQKQQWIITHDPMRLEFGDVKFQVDLGAERLLAAERGSERIAIEIKSFLKASAITDFYGALGQFLSYRLALTALEPDRLLYMAVPLDAYKTFFQLGFTKAAIESYKILLIVYDIDNEVIVEWIN